jgi:hypothetical protein
VAKPDASRKIPYQFPSDKFRNAIRFVFEMAASTDEDRKLTFHFADTVTVTGTADSEEVPFDPTVPVTRVVKTPVTVPCDIEFQQAGDEPTAFGVVVPAKVKVLLLDEDYELVKDASFIVVNGDKYTRNYEPPDFALFDVGLHEMVFIAENER